MSEKSFELYAKSGEAVILRSVFFRTRLILPLMISALLFLSCASSKKDVVSLSKNEWRTNHTYVFVHGLSGWGHYDFVNKLFPYWGMKNGSLIKTLNKAGFAAVDASVAPQGSAWDRACELYAQLSGTVTDYGAEHSARCGHARFGRDFSRNPLINQWDDEHKINLLGHSFGGVTVRLLAHLMAEGSQAERDATNPDDLSPLFAGGHASWIYSVTTLAAPHNGTSAYHIPDENPGEKTRMQKAMDKHNAPKDDGRADYDNAAFDMHVQNAGEINRWLSTLGGAYYFSFACRATVPDEEGNQIPEEEIMESLFQRSSRRMGAFEGTSPDGVVFGKEWQENDGLVNTVSAKSPDFAPRKDFSWDDGTAERGVWLVMPVYHGDHMSLQGGLTIKNPVADFYMRHLDMINRL